MNSRAIDDLLGTILTQWYGTVALWQAPGVLSDATCDPCRSSLVSAALDVSQWPHDLLHRLDSDLDDAATLIGESLAEDETGCASADHQCARELLRDALVAHSDDLLDVLTECVSPKLDRFVGLEVERALRELDTLSDPR